MTIKTAIGDVSLSQQPTDSADTATWTLTTSSTAGMLGDAHYEWSGIDAGAYQNINDHITLGTTNHIGSTSPWHRYNGHNGQWPQQVGPTPGLPSMPSVIDNTYDWLAKPDKKQIDLDDQGTDAPLITVTDKGDNDSEIEFDYSDFEVLKALVEVFKELDRDDPIHQAVTDKMEERRTDRAMKKLGHEGDDD